MVTKADDENCEVNKNAYSQCYGMSSRNYAIQIGRPVFRIRMRNKPPYKYMERVRAKSERYFSFFICKIVLYLAFLVICTRSPKP